MKRTMHWFALMYLLGSWSAYGQESDGNNPQSPHFSEVWVWEYTTTDGQKAEMAIYRAPQLNYWLLTNEAYGLTDEMSLWFIVKPNGEVIQAYQDPESIHSKKLMFHRLSVVKKSKLPSYWKATGETRLFGDRSLGFPLWQGKGFQVRYLKSSDRSSFYLASTKADFALLSSFNSLDIDAKLPIQFPKDIPAHLITLSENTTFPGGNSIQYRFKYISQATYFIDVTEFK